MELLSPGLGLIFWMTLSFGIVLLILRKFAWAPILWTIREREREIAISLRNAQHIKRELEELETLKKQKVAEADKQHQELLVRAKTEAENVLREARIKAGDDAHQLLENARNAIEVQKKSAMLEIKHQIASLSVDMAEKVLQEEFSDKEKNTRFVNGELEKVILN